MNDKFLKPYNPQETERAIYELWEKSGYFNPDNLPGERTESFTIVLPPPNVTGTLHMGHAAMLAIEDALIRHARMKGKRALWIPGTDSAAIATQSKVEKEIQKKEGKSRHDLGRDELLKRIDAFAEDSKNTILNQVRAMGSSLDWSRYAYTMDEVRYRAVMEAFIRMYNAGLIYRGHRIVNWDPKGQTVISDDEVVHEEREDTFYEFQYGPFVIGTARPETKFGDKYVVMHPEDERYAAFTHGQTIELEWINGPISATVIKDTAVDREFGTGVMTITPWHDATDFDIAERHGLDKEQIIDQYGKLLPIAGEFAGMKITDAKEKIVEKLRAKGLVVSEKKYVHNVATAERTGGLVEPQVMLQWFVAVDKPFTIPHSKIPGIPSGSTITLKDLMITAVKSGAVSIGSERFEKIYFNWINHLRPWCISRQIWFGHRIPVWYKGDEMKVQVASPGEGWEQDPDTLDTWFSSGLWTFSTLGWPDATEDLKRFHPTTVLETGYDILFFWVARMILMSGFLLGQVPFTHVYLHGLVRDEKGRKMSKSLGNILDPLELIEKYGADAARLSLLIGVAPGNDQKLSEQRVKGYKNFANKVWNISRFILENTEAYLEKSAPSTPNDQALIDDAYRVVDEINQHIEQFRLDLAGDAAYHYVWHTLADKIIEESKPILNGTDEASKFSRAHTLYTLLTLSLKMLHPFMPFVTEEVWQHLPKKETELLMVAGWPAKHTVQ